MSNKFTLNRLSDTEFEEFCYDLLKELGFINLNWRKGTGKTSSPSDSGRDIEAQKISIDDVDGETILENWFFECKHYTKGIPPEKIQGALSWANTENPDKLVILASNFLSNPCKEYIKKYVKNNKPKYKIKTWENKELEKFSFGKIKLLRKYKLSEGLDFINLIHPVHLIYSLKEQYNTLDYLFSILDKYDSTKRNDLIINSYPSFINIHFRKPVTGKETLGELQIEDLNYHFIKKHCYELKSSLPETFIVNSFMNLILGCAFHFGDKTILDDLIKNNQDLISSLKEKIKANEKEKDKLESLIKEIQERVKELPKRTEHYYSLYVDFCENVISKLLVEDITKAIKNFKGDFE
jgi:hypothetical protein